MIEGFPNLTAALKVIASQRKHPHYSMLMKWLYRGLPKALRVISSDTHLHTAWCADVCNRDHNSQKG